MKQVYDLRDLQMYMSCIDQVASESCKWTMYKDIVVVENELFNKMLQALKEKEAEASEKTRRRG